MQTLHPHRLEELPAVTVGTGSSVHRSSKTISGKCKKRLDAGGRRTPRNLLCGRTVMEESQGGQTGKPKAPEKDRRSSKIRDLWGDSWGTKIASGKKGKAQINGARLGSVNNAITPLERRGRNWGKVREKVLVQKNGKQRGDRAENSKTDTTEPAEARN